MNQGPKIIIIGAGASGISAASRLIENGLVNVTVLEAQSRFGGRIQTVDFADSKVDLGAQWVHGEVGNIVYGLVKDYNLLDSSANFNKRNFDFVNSSGETLSRDAASEILKIYYKYSDQVSEEKLDPLTTFGKYFLKKYGEEIKNVPEIPQDKKEEVLNWIEAYDSSIQGCDSWFNVSASRLGDYWECDGDPVLNWKTYGYAKIFDIITKKFPDPSKSLSVFDKIFYSKEVTLIDYSNKNQIKVSTSDGVELLADHVIVTCSLGVLKQTHEKIFNPALPIAKQRSIQGLSIGVVDKIMIEFPYKWWSENFGGFCFTWSNEEKNKFQQSHIKNQHWLLGVFMFVTVDYQPKVLSAWVTGPSARYMETLSDEQVTSDLYFLLNMFLKNIYDIPKPKKIVRSNWFTNKYFRGSYSYQSIETEKTNANQKDLADPIVINQKPMVLFAGEATHDHYYSTVHGAVETGFREADRLIEFYKNLLKLPQKSKL